MMERVLKKVLAANAHAAEREWLASILLGAFRLEPPDEAGLIAHGAEIKRR
ncbi:hypothetical protein P9228_06115 [Mesorhizobium sp. WSM4898]|uniref:hypothetical protein n=1 Tax=Mesorhizobium sp. WSM4898 TaxID=3038544 RepID=UPI0024156745|nr:hypothetical protein [Mesorhizobium sp. WSM4898]MDG4906023.1 hypothetical protein [Mesorhizobium sp. WSM4898]